VGEPINPEAWMWYYNIIGNKGALSWIHGGRPKQAYPYNSYSWATPLKTRFCHIAFSGIEPMVVKADGTEADENEGGQLVIKKPWPGMMRTVYGITSVL